MPKDGSVVIHRSEGCIGGGRMARCMWEAEGNRRPKRQRRHIMVSNDNYCNSSEGSRNCHPFTEGHEGDCCNILMDTYHRLLGLQMYQDGEEVDIMPPSTTRVPSISVAQETPYVDGSTYDGGQDCNLSTSPMCSSTHGSDSDWVSSVIHRRVLAHQHELTSTIVRVRRLWRKTAKDRGMIVASSSVKCLNRSSDISSHTKKYDAYCSDSNAINHLYTSVREPVNSDSENLIYYYRPSLPLYTSYSDNLAKLSFSTLLRSSRRSRSCQQKTKSGDPQHNIISPLSSYLSLDSRNNPLVGSVQSAVRDLSNANGINRLPLYVRRALSIVMANNKDIIDSNSDADLLQGPLGPYRLCNQSSLRRSTTSTLLTHKHSLLTIISQKRNFSYTNTNPSDPHSLCCMAAHFIVASFLMNGYMSYIINYSKLQQYLLGDAEVFVSNRSHRDTPVGQSGTKYPHTSKATGIVKDSVYNTNISRGSGVGGNTMALGTSDINSKRLFSGWNTNRSDASNYLSPTGNSYGSFRGSPRDDASSKMGRLVFEGRNEVKDSYTSLLNEITEPINDLNDHSSSLFNDFEIFSKIILCDTSRRNRTQPSSVGERHSKSSSNAKQMKQKRSNRSTLRHKLPGDITSSPLKTSIPLNKTHNNNYKKDLLMGSQSTGNGDVSRRKAQYTIISSNYRRSLANQRSIRSTSHMYSYLSLAKGRLVKVWSMEGCRPTSGLLPTLRVGEGMRGLDTLLSSESPAHSSLFLGVDDLLSAVSQSMEIVRDPISCFTSSDVKKQLVEAPKMIGNPGALIRDVLSVTRDKNTSREGQNTVALSGERSPPQSLSSCTLLCRSSDSATTVFPNIYNKTVLDPACDGHSNSNTMSNYNENSTAYSKSKNPLGAETTETSTHTINTTVTKDDGDVLIQIAVKEIEQAVAQFTVVDAFIQQASVWAWLVQETVPQSLLGLFIETSQMGKSQVIVPDSQPPSSLSNNKLPTRRVKRMRVSTPVASYSPLLATSTISVIDIMCVPPPPLRPLVAIVIPSERVSLSQSNLDREHCHNSNNSRMFSPASHASNKLSCYRPMAVGQDYVSTLRRVESDGSNFESTRGGYTARMSRKTSSFLMFPLLEAVRRYYHISWVIKEGLYECEPPVAFSARGQPVRGDLNGIKSSDSIKSLMDRDKVRAMLRFVAWTRATEYYQRIIDIVGLKELFQVLQTNTHPNIGEIIPVDVEHYLDHPATPLMTYPTPSFSLLVSPATPVKFPDDIYFPKSFTEGNSDNGLLLRFPPRDRSTRASSPRAYVRFQEACPTCNGELIPPVGRTTIWKCESEKEVTNTTNQLSDHDISIQNKHSIDYELTVVSNGDDRNSGFSKSHEHVDGAPFSLSLAPTRTVPQWAADILSSPMPEISVTLQGNTEETDDSAEYIDSTLNIHVNELPGAIPQSHEGVLRTNSNKDCVKQHIGIKRAPKRGSDRNAIREGGAYTHYSRHDISDSDDAGYSSTSTDDIVDIIPDAEEVSEDPTDVSLCIVAEIHNDGRDRKPFTQIAQSSSTKYESREPERQGSIGAADSSEGSRRERNRATRGSLSGSKSKYKNTEAVRCGFCRVM